MKTIALTITILIAAAAFAEDTDKEGFAILFDKEHSTGWKMAGPGGFKIEDGVMIGHGGMGLYWHEKEVGDFTLRLEFKQKNVNHNSGVFVRFPNPGNDPWVAVNKGYEIQIAGDKPGTHNTGSVYSFKAATEVPIKPAGEWNDYEITVVGQKYTIKLNGKVINEFTGNRTERGRIGLQNHDDGSPVSFRNIRIKELK